MKKFKRVKIKPLTKFEETNIKIHNNYEYDASDLNDVDQAKVVSFLNKLSNGKSFTEIGNQSFVNSTLKPSESKETYIFPEPNPICIYFNQANSHLEKAIEIKEEILNESSYNAPVNYDLFCSFYQEASQGLIMLATTIEGFINQLIPDNEELIIGRDKFSKNNLEWKDVKFKIKEMVPVITNINFLKSNENDYNNICAIINLRNDIVHLKKNTSDNHTKYQNLFKGLFDFKFEAASESVYIFVNTIYKDYFTLK